jgi:uncharacterized small protein (DUF1192 family)
MAECPWCHAVVKDVRAPCPKCGKLAGDLRMSDPPEPMPADVPDLVIPAPRQSKPTPLAPAMDNDLQIDLAAASPPKQGVMRPPTPGAGFSPFDDDMSAGPSLELDTGGGGSLPPRISSPSVTVGNAPQPPAPISHDWARDEIAPASGIITDPFEARALADFGPAPDAFWQAPMYAYRVMSRRSELRRALVETRVHADKTSKRVEDALVSLGEKARRVVQDGPAAARVKAAEDMLRSRDSALAGAMDAYKAAVADIDARLAPVQAELAAARAEEAKAEAAREAAEADVKRAEAKLKRIDIEIRNGANKQAERDPAAADVAKAAQKLAEQDRVFGDAKRKAAATLGRVEAIDAERTAQEQRFARQSGTRGAGVDDAQQQLRAALADLGRTMLADRSLGDLTAPRDEVVRLEAEAGAKAKSVALHESALESYEPGKVWLGVALVAAALVLVVAVMLFPFIYRSFAS